MAVSQGWKERETIQFYVVLFINGTSIYLFHCENYSLFCTLERYTSILLSFFPIA